MTDATARASPLAFTGPPSTRFAALPCPNRNAPRMIAAKAATLTTVVASLTAPPTRAPSTLAKVSVTRAAIPIACTVNTSEGTRSRLSRNSANTVASAAMVAGVVTST